MAAEEPLMTSYYRVLPKSIPELHAEALRLYDRRLAIARKINTLRMEQDVINTQINQIQEEVRKTYPRLFPSPVASNEKQRDYSGDDS